MRIVKFLERSTPRCGKMEIDLNSQIEIAQDITNAVISKHTRDMMPYSLAILQKHYKLQCVRIVLILKTLTYREYIVAHANNQFFYTRNGKFWSPLPVLSPSDISKLGEKYGINSTEPFIGDPGVVLYEGITELHRISNLVQFLYEHALYPAKAVQQEQRFQGIDVTKGCEIQSFIHPNGKTPNYDEYCIHCCPQKSLITICYRYLPQFKSYYYLNTRVYGFVYGDRDYQHTNGLLRVDTYIFDGAQPKISQEWLERFESFDKQFGYEKIADQTVLQSRQAKIDGLEERKANLRRQIREYKEERERRLAAKKAEEERLERERLEKERLEKEKAEEAEEKDEKEKEGEGEVQE